MQQLVEVVRRDHIGFDIREILLCQVPQGVAGR
jgi:hypothetical protein